MAERRPRSFAGLGRSSYNRDWTQGSTAKNLWLLAWPMIVGSVVMQFDTVVDMIWVARLGASSVAGVGVAGILVMLLSSARMGLSTGQRAMVARAVGANEMDAANHVTMQALLMNLAYALVTILVGVALAEPMMRLMGVEAEVARQGENYLRIMMFSQAAMSLGMMAQTSMTASGDAVNPMVISIGTRILHVVVAPLLIFGWGGFPRLEVSGAALANALASVLGAAAAVWMLASGYTRLRMRLTWRVDLSTMWEMIKIGIPAAVNSAERSIARTFITRILATFGTYGVAAHTIAGRVDMLTEIISQGLGQSAGVLVGQNLGAGRPDRSYRSAWAAMGYGGLTSFALFIIVIWKAEAIVRIFNPDPELVKVTSLYLRILACQSVSMCGAIVFSSALQGAGDTIPVMVASIATLWGLELTLSYFLPKITGWGVYSLAAATVIATSVRVVLYIAYFQWGKWKEKKIRIGGGERARAGS